ncbi:MAG TPA: FAD-binding oxidoreductase [Geminicoccus sp.]|jgi:glycine/D-amino acid oxidase-like deaminating enzyme|uniref:NAD(P)/FAD-dependent oxidoreductase n=1 Tax=Geminicoccus sp. TaxID=2024832 RepID=UPI002E31697B|nr:FAD-binding oxidoreductase [Geminicoccus sp.]HEX2526596.1 FAD-binding oxidoreductase [Geminicoccus sp.]
MQRSPLEPSLWYATAPPAPPTDPIDGEVTADVCVVGGGYTGLSTALHLAEKGVRVVLLEAKEIGFGGSGRNAGHCTPTFHFYSIPTVRKMLGPVYGERLVQRQTNATNLAFDIIRRYGIDCEGVQNGYLMVAHAPSKVKVLEEKQRTYASAGKTTHLLDKAETERLTGSPRYYGAWLHPEGGHLNPLAYARGLARAVISQGGVIHTYSPVRGIETAGKRWRVVTPTGAVTADKVVCGTGAYTDGYWPGLDKTFTILSVAILATQPLSDNVRKTVAPENHTVVETRDDPMIYKYNKDGRLVTSVFVEGRRGDDHDYTKKLTAEKLKWILPQLSEVDFQYYWTGDLDMQPKTFPRLFELAPGIVASLGYSGRGVPTGTMMGTVLSEWAMGVPKEDLALPLEPLEAAPLYMKFVPRLFLSVTRARDQWVARREGVNPPPY